ncbi:GIY-YIG catalytic domain-containing protein [Xylariaceae sp. FL0255]|nr:GIY-YIG catalytic domain-containing protein [Xylariaceae sp. FL0255]
MPGLSAVIPPLYTVYILRSTVHHASLYIGSTPNPPRRLKQHNGEAKGGAARTSRSTLRPWEMVGLVSGFPGMVAALKFEWALNNSHLSLHIPQASRISVSTQRKRNGHPKRPRHSLASIISNVHLLLRVPSFARWPLKLHFFAPEAHQAWVKWCETQANGKNGDAERLRATIPVFTDFGPGAGSGERVDDASTATTAATTSEEHPEGDRPWGIHALPLNYTLLKPYVEKTKSLYGFEREGNCVVCGETLHPNEGLYATCSNTGCEGTGHVTCWSRHFLSKGEGNDNAEGDDGDIIPISGTCPNCDGEVMWGDMMMEMSLRVRGQKEVEKLLKKPRKKRTTKAAVAAET